MKKILITGGAGFIGSNLCDVLIKDGHEVFCLDNLYTGKYDNIKHLVENKNFHYIFGDVVDCKLNIGKVDEIYNLACPASPPAYQKYPIKTILTNIYGLNNVLEYAVKYNAKVLQTSTSEVYGDPLTSPQSENYWGNVNPFGERSCYDEGKRCAEALCYSYMKQERADVRVIRIFNTYGPNMDVNDGRVISNFIVQALKNKPVTVYGTGMQTRSPQYISDLIDGIKQVMKMPYGALKSPINIGNPDEHTILDLAEKIISMTNSKSIIEHKPLPCDDPKKRKPDIKFANEIINWHPKVSLEYGLNETIKYFKSILATQSI